MVHQGSKRSGGGVYKSSRSDKPRKNRVSNACEACKTRKTKCSGHPSPCVACASINAHCHFSPRLDFRRKGSYKPSVIQERQQFFLLALIRTLKHAEYAEVTKLLNLIRNQSRPEELARCLEENFIHLQYRGVLPQMEFDESDILSLGLQSFFHDRKDVLSVNIVRNKREDVDSSSISTRSPAPQSESDKPISTTPSIRRQQQSRLMEETRFSHNEPCTGMTNPTPDPSETSTSPPPPLETTQIASPVVGEQSSWAKPTPKQPSSYSLSRTPNPTVLTPPTSSKAIGSTQPHVFNQSGTSSRTEFDPVTPSYVIPVAQLRYYNPYSCPPNSTSSSPQQTFTHTEPRLEGMDWRSTASSRINTTYYPPNPLLAVTPTSRNQCVWGQQHKPTHTATRRRRLSAAALMAAQFDEVAGFIDQTYPLETAPTKSSQRLGVNSISASPAQVEHLFDFTGYYSGFPTAIPPSFLSDTMG